MWDYGNVIQLSIPTFQFFTSNFDVRGKNSQSEYCGKKVRKKVQKYVFIEKNKGLLY